MNYTNFDILIQDKRGGRYPIIVLPYVMGSDDYLSDDILSDEILVDLQKCDEDRTDDKLLEQVGKHLYNCLFQGNVRDRFRDELTKVSDNNSLGIRIRLVIEPGLIAALPWELLYDPARKLFLATWNKTPVTRYLKMTPSSRDLTLIPPVSVLVAIPAYSGLKVESEKQIVEEAFAGLVKDGLVELDFLESKVTLTTIADKLSSKKYHIFHFIGHGCFQLGDEEGFVGINWDDDEDRDEEDQACSKIEGIRWLSGTRVANWFTNHPSVKLIILNSCQGAQTSTTKPLAGVVPCLFRREIPAVIAMQYPIYDEAARLFSARFYNKLCKGYERGLIDVALSDARDRMLQKRPGRIDFATPVLYMLSDTGVLFDLKDSRDVPPYSRSAAQPPLTESATDEEPLASEIGKDPPAGLVDKTSRLFRGVGSPVRTVNESSRWQAVRQARLQEREILKDEVRREADLEKRQELMNAIVYENLEIGELDKRLSGVVKATFQITAFSVAVSLVLLVASFYGLLNIAGAQDLMESGFSALLRTSGSRAFGNDQIRIILVDENSHVGEFPHTNIIQDRQNHAELITALSRAGAKVVALDFDFKNESEQWDSKLAEAIQAASDQGTQVVIGVDGVNARGEPEFAIPPTLSPILKDNWGNITSAVEQAGFRQIIYGVVLGDEISAGPLQNHSDQGVSISPSFMLQVLRQFRRNDVSPQPFFDSARQTLKLVDQQNRVVQAIPVVGDEMSFDITYPSEDTLSKVRLTYQEVYSRRDDLSFLRNNFAGRIVIVGYRQGDLHLISGGGRQMYGSEIQASALSNIFQKIYRKRLSTAYDFSIMLAMALLGFVAQTKGRRLRFEVPFRMPALRKMVRIPVLLSIITILYLGVIFLIYSGTPYVISTTYHLAALFTGYWGTSLLSGLQPLQPDRFVVTHAREEVLAE